MPPGSDSDSADEKTSSRSSRVLNDAVYGAWKLRTLQALDRKQVGQYADGTSRAPHRGPGDPAS